MKTPFKPLAEQAEPRAIEPDDLAQPSSPVEEQVAVAVDRIEPHSPHSPSERVERATHVDGLDAHEDTHPGAKAQHDDTTRSSRLSACSSKRGSTSTAIAPQRTTKRTGSRLTAGVATSSTSLGITRLAGDGLPPRRRLVRQALSDRASIPCSRVHSDRLTPHAVTDQLRPGGSRWCPKFGSVMSFFAADGHGVTQSMSSLGVIASASAAGIAPSL